MPTPLAAPFPTSLPLVPTRFWSRVHYGKVTSLAFNSDGAYLASGDCDGVVCIFDVARNKAAVIIHLDTSVSVTALLWIGASRLVIGSSEGSVTFWELDKRNVKVPAKLVDVLPTYFPFAPRILACLPEGESTFLIVAALNTAEVWHYRNSRIKRQPQWEGLGQLTSNDKDRVVGCWILNCSTAVIAFHLEGIRIWSFQDDLQNTLTNWPVGTTVHSAHLITSLAQTRSGEDETGLVGDIVVMTDTGVMHFGLSLLPIPHVQILQQFPLMPDMVTLSCTTIWGNAPILFTPSAAGLVAMDLTYHRYRLVTGTLESRTTQVIHIDNGTRHQRLASFSSKFCRQAASSFEGSDGWVIQLWSTDGSGCSSKGCEPTNAVGTPVTRLHEQLPKLLSGRKAGSLRRLWRLVLVRLMLFATILAPTILILASLGSLKVQIRSRVSGFSRGGDM